jgi:hypothetical protein
LINSSKFLAIIEWFVSKCFFNVTHYSIILVISYYIFFLKHVIGFEGSIGFL